MGICRELAEKEQRARLQWGRQRGSRERQLPAASFQQMCCSPAKCAFRSTPGAPCLESCFTATVYLERKCRVLKFVLTQFLNNSVTVLVLETWLEYVSAVILNASNPTPLWRTSSGLVAPNVALTFGVSDCRGEGHCRYLISLSSRLLLSTW